MRLQLRPQILLQTLLHILQALLQLSIQPFLYLRLQFRKLVEKSYTFICGVAGIIMVFGLALYCGLRKPKKRCPTCERPY